MIDMQNSRDNREIPIDLVGVKDLTYPIFILDRNHEKQQTTARVSMSVNLPQEFKGTHMSRFIEVLNEYRGEITMRTLPALLHDLKERLQAESAHVELAFPYFVEKAAPVSGARAMMDYQCAFIAEANGGEMDFVLRVIVPVTTLCPCSKAISDYGAHNQRGYVDIRVRSVPGQDGQPTFVWIEELIEVAEASGSAPVFPLLKREDERHVTMQAFDNPVFVEDLVRNVAVRLRTDERVAWYCVEAANMESIHNHAAFARTEWSRSDLSRNNWPSSGSTR
jgi:GTP cyclohydrolase I